MLVNRTMPASTVIPVLVDEDPSEAVDWLVDAFGFTVRWRAGEHRAQLAIGDGAVVVGERRIAPMSEATDPTVFRTPRRGEVSHSILVRVQDVDSHYAAGSPGRGTYPAAAGGPPVRRAPVLRR